MRRQMNDVLKENLAGAASVLSEIAELEDPDSCRIFTHRDRRFWPETSSWPAETAGAQQMPLT